MQKNSPGTKVLAGQARNTAASHTIPSSFSYRRTPWFRKKSTMHYYFYWSITAGVVLVSAVEASESASHVHIMPSPRPFEPPSYPSGLSQSTELKLPSV